MQKEELLTLAVTLRRTALAIERAFSSDPVSPPSNHTAEAVRAVLERHSFNIRRASIDYGVSRVTMYRLIRRFSIPFSRA